MIMVMIIIMISGDKSYDIIFSKVVCDSVGDSNEQQ